MEWEKPVEKFLEKWKGRMIGALVTGSAVNGTSNKFSDVDLDIILPAGTKWRERGNKIVDGVLIEYFANPPEQIRKYFEDQWKMGRPATARMFSIGKIVHDPHGIVGELVKEARRWLRKKPPFSRQDREQLKYSAWDMADDIEGVPEEWFPYVYYQFLGDLFTRYSRIIGWGDPLPSKIWKFLKMKEKYGVGEYPDKEFLKLFLKAIKRPDKKMLKKIVKHIHQKLGGFEIDGWKLRTKVEM